MSAFFCTKACKLTGHCPNADRPALYKKIRQLDDPTTIFYDKDVFKNVWDSIHDKSYDTEEHF